MRVLLAPVYDVGVGAKAEGDSQFLWARKFIDLLVESGQYTYWLLPEQYPKPDLQRVEFLSFKLGTGTERYSQNITRHYLPEELILAFQSPVTTKMLDYVITNDAYFGLMLQQFFCSRRFTIPTPVVIYDNYPTIIGWAEQNWVGNDNDESMLFSRALGYALCETVGCSPYVSARCGDLVRSYVNPLLAVKFMRDRRWIMNFVDTKYFDRVDTTKNEKFSLFFGGRFTGTKGGETSVDQYLKPMIVG